MKSVLNFSMVLMMSAVLVAGCDKDDDNGGTTVNQQDKDFVRMAAMSNFAEISAGAIAADKAQNDGIAAYGQMMVTEHTTASQQLKTLASGLTLNAPDSLDAQHVALKDSLMSLNGIAFDSVYIMSQVRDHQNAITLFQNEANSGSHQALREFAESMIPHLQEHFEMADSLANVIRVD
jgi:putative membrane protein